MAVDLRHWIWCSLGPLAPTEAAVTLADDHIQGRGVCMVRGTVILQGIYRPNMGDPVSLAYGNGAYLARVPRRLRVLSSSADPLARTTTVSVGCLLALFENRRPPVENPTEAEENAVLSYSVTSPGGGQQESPYSPSVIADIRSIAALPISAKWVTQKILTALGLTAAGEIPFKIRRVVDEWDLSVGYVEELGRIAESERYFCRINEAEQLEFVSKEESDDSTAPLLTAAEVLSFQPVNVGELPGDAVYAKYQSTKLNLPIAGFSSDGQGGQQQDPLLPDEKRKRNWEYEAVTSGPVFVTHSYTNASGALVVQQVSYNNYSVTETSYDDKDRVKSRIERSNTLNGERRSITTFTYGIDSAVLMETTEEFIPLGDIAAQCGMNGPAEQFKMGLRRSGVRTVTYDKDSGTGSTLTITTQSTLYVLTQFGSNAVAVLREEGRPFQELIEVASQLIPLNPTSRIRSERNFGLQQRPGQQARNKAALQKATPPEDAPTTSMVWAVGSPTSETAVELSPPYTSDDYIRAFGATPAYSITTANAEQQALAYARTENFLRLGNRNGAGLQLSPLDCPARPFSQFFLRLNGCTARYRTNGTTWTMGTGGVTITTDALFRGAVDGTFADAWFPLPPGVSSLPTAGTVTTNANPRPANYMAVPGGFNPQNPDLVALFAALPTAVAAIPRATLNPAGPVIRPWLETVRLRGGVRVGGRMFTPPMPPPSIAMRGGVRVGGRMFQPSLIVQPARGTARGMPLTLTSDTTISLAITPARGSGRGVPLTLTSETPGLSLVTTRAGLSGTDFLDWAQLGAESASVELTQPITATTDDSLNVTVTGAASLYRYDEGGAWDGNFGSGDALLYQDGSDPVNTVLPIVITFASAITAVGAQIQNNWNGAFTAKIEVFAGTTSLGSSTVSGNSAISSPPAAVFLGIRSGSANITTVKFSLTAGPEPELGQFAINRVELA
jgi:hypothetical protein